MPIVTQADNHLSTFSSPRRDAGGCNPRQAQTPAPACLAPPDSSPLPADPSERLASVKQTTTKNIYKYGYMYTDRQAGGCLEGCMDRYNEKCFT